MQSQNAVLSSNSTGFSGTWVAIAGLTKLPFPKKKRNTIDMTDLSAPGNFEQLEVSLLRRNQELEFEYNTNASRLDAMDLLVETDVPQYFKITHPALTKTIWFTGLVTDHDPGDNQVDQKVSGKLKIMPTGQIYIQTTAPS